MQRQAARIHDLAAGQNRAVAAERIRPSILQQCWYSHVLSAPTCHVQWNTYTPEASFETVCNGEQYASMILQQGGPEALAQWKRLEDEMRPLQQGASTFPAAALRSDVGAHIPCGLACCCAVIGRAQAADWTLADRDKRMWLLWI